MQSDTWLGRIWTRIKVGVVQDVPPSIEECECCREVDCTQERWLNCARRIGIKAELDTADGETAPSVTGRTDEMPGVYTVEDSPVASEENEAAESVGRRKSISSSGD